MKPARPYDARIKWIWLITFKTPLILQVTWPTLTRRPEFRKALDFHEYQSRKLAELDLAVCDRVNGRLEIKTPWQHRGCPYCQGTECLTYSNPRLSKGLSYVRCRICKTVYPLPRLNQEAMNQRVDSQILNDYYRHSLQRPPPSGAQESFQRELEFLGKHVPLGPTEKTRVLEVGSADGRFLKALTALGCRVTGVEPNSITADHARSQGLDILHGVFQPGMPLPASHFDLIVFRESLYHFFDVRQTLDFCRELLVDGGAIYIKCFNVDSYAIRFFGGASRGINGLDIPGNFSPESLGYILTDRGFQVYDPLFFPEGPVAGYLVDGKLMRSSLARYPRGVLNRVISRALIWRKKSRNFAFLGRKLPLQP